MPLSELENDSESVWVKVFANKTSHHVASWYKPPSGSTEDFHLFGDQLDQIRNKHKGNKLPSVHVLGDFNFKDIAWPDRLNKSDSMLSQSEGQMGPVKRICVFEHSVMTNFNCACPAIQRSKGSGFLSEGSS